MEKEFTLKKYDSIDELYLASIQLEDETMTMDDLKDISVGMSDGGDVNYDMSYQEQVDMIKEQGLWGWVDEDKIIHYWIGKEVSMTELIHFFAHEIAHRTGTPIEDDFQEELRAEGYGETATLAYRFANQVIGQE